VAGKVKPQWHWASPAQSCSVCSVAGAAVTVLAASAASAGLQGAARLRAWLQAIRPVGRAVGMPGRKRLPRLPRQPGHPPTHDYAVPNLLGREPAGGSGRSAVLTHGAGLRSEAPAWGFAKKARLLAEAGERQRRAGATRALADVSTSTSAGVLPFDKRGGNCMPTLQAGKQATDGRSRANWRRHASG